MKGKIIKGIMTVIQILILIPPILLQYLSKRKMGVARYLIFKKQMLPKQIFTQEIMYGYTAVLVLGAIFSIVLLVHYYRKKINGIIVKILITTFSLNLAAIFFVFSKSFEKLLAYHFFLIAIIVIMAVQYIRVICGVRCSKP